MIYGMSICLSIWWREFVIFYAAEKAYCLRKCVDCILDYFGNYMCKVGSEMFIAYNMSRSKIQNCYESVHLWISTGLFWTMTVV